MKKTIAILLSLMTICMFSFTGCGGSGSSEDAGGSDAELGKVEANPDGTLMPFALCPGMNDDGTVNFTWSNDMGENGDRAGFRLTLAEYLAIEGNADKVIFVPEIPESGD